MKKIYITFIILFSFYFSLFAQIETEAVNESMEKGKKPGIAVLIPGIERKDAEKEWKDRLKDFDNNDVDNNRKSVFGDDVLIESISPNTVDIYTNFEEVKDRKTRMVVFINLGGKFLSQSDESWENANNIVKNFAVKMAKNRLSEKLDEQKDKLDDQKDDLEDLQDDKTDLEDDIEDYKEKIKEAEEEIKEIEKKQEKKEEIIESQKKIVDKLKNKLDNLE